jgi:hypothetical protein
MDGKNIGTDGKSAFLCTYAADAHIMMHIAQVIGININT